MKLYLDIFKAHGPLNKGKLVLKRVEVKRQNGTTYWRMQWVDPNDKTGSEHSRKTDPVDIPSKEHANQGIRWGDLQQNMSNNINDKFDSGELIPKNDKGGKLRGAKIGGVMVTGPGLHALEIGKENGKNIKDIELGFYRFLSDIYHEDDHEDIIEKMNFLKEHCHHSPITINFDPFSDGMIDTLMEHGTYDNIYEVKEKGLHEPDSFYISDRTSTEEDIFGIPRKSAGKHRPIYGALNICKEPHGAAMCYGMCSLVLKPEVKNRSTTTEEDSFSIGDKCNVFSGDGYIATMKHLMSNDNRLGDVFNDGSHVTGISEDYYDDDSFGGEYYVESQIFGGVDLNRDVSEITYPSTWENDGDGQEHIQKLQQLGEKFGISVTMVDLPEGESHVEYDSVVNVNEDDEEEEKRSLRRLLNSKQDKTQ